MRNTADGRGRGMFATSFIKKGDFILVEKPYVDSRGLSYTEEEYVAMGFSHEMKFDGKETHLAIAFNLLKKMRVNKFNAALVMSNYQWSKSGAGLQTKINPT